MVLRRFFSENATEVGPSFFAVLFRDDPDKLSRTQRCSWRRGSVVLAALALTTTGCGPKSPPTVQPSSHRHVHIAPHGGTPVVLGKEAYHLEWVRAPDTGTLTAYLLDGEMENFVRSGESSLTLDATINERKETLVLHAVANAATGESVGDTSEFEAQAEWLKTAASFTGTLRKITVRNSTFENVVFPFPGGNDQD